MIRSINIILYSAVDKSVVKKYTNLSVDEATAIIPNDGFLCLSGNNRFAYYKVAQIAKEINESIFPNNESTLIVHIFMNEVSDKDFYQFK